MFVNNPLLHNICSNKNLRNTGNIAINIVELLKLNAVLIEVRTQLSMIERKMMVCPKMLHYNIANSLVVDMNSNFVLITR